MKNTHVGVLLLVNLQAAQSISYNGYQGKPRNYFMKVIWVKVVNIYFIQLVFP